MKIYIDTQKENKSILYNLFRYKKYFEVQNQYIEIIKEFGFKYLCYFIERKELHYDII